MPSRKTKAATAASSSTNRLANNSDTAITTTTTNNPDSSEANMTWCGKMLIFLMLPLCVGIGGLVAGYLATFDNPDRKLRIEKDFALPFAMALLMVVVIGFQTNGFTTKAKPIVQWPKVEKKKKIVHKHVVKGQDPNSVPDVTDENDEQEGEKETTAKKND